MATAANTEIRRPAMTRQWLMRSVLPPMGAFVTTPQTIRAHAATMLAVWGLRRFGTLDADTRVVVSELVTNTVLASAGSNGTPAYIGGRLPVIQFGMFSDWAVVRVEVWDMMPGEPLVQQPGGLEEHGRGLAMVGALSEEWGTYPDGGGKVVWAQLRVPHAA